MTKEFASAETWTVVREGDRIVAAFERLDDALARFQDDSTVAFRRVPHQVSQRPFVWGVVTTDNHVDSVHGGDAEAATERAREIAGELKLFLA